MLGYISELYHNYMNKPQDFYYLSLSKEPDGFYSISGLRPQYSLNSSPTYCRAVNFSIDKLEPIIDKLNKYWDSTKDKNKDFWRNEYEKYGSCMFYAMSEFDYFNKIVELYEYALINNIIKKKSDKKPNSDQIVLIIDSDFNIV
jgi:ribonuclease I